MMQHHKLVLPENLNHYGFLFGGYLLKWVDEVAWIAATLEYPGCKFVTIAMDQVEFRQSVRGGSILSFSAKQTRLGNTSISYFVEVSYGSPSEPLSVFATTVTMVRVDDNGNKKPISDSPDAMEYG
jgi:acyl-CoA hydrolase